MNYKIFKIKIFFICYILVYCNYANAQIASSVSSFNLDIKDLNSQPSVNSIINKLLEINNKKKDDIVIIINFDEQIFLYNENNKIKVDLNLDANSATSDTYYKNFSILNKLLPSKIKYDIVFSTYNNIYISSSFETQGFDVDNKLKFSYYLQDTVLNNADSVTYNISIKNRNFIFEEISFIKFDRYINLIDEYYESLDIIKNSIKNLNKIIPDSVEMVAAYNIQLKQIENIIKNIQTKNFSSQLNLDKNDPGDFMKNMQLLTDEFDIIKRKIDYTFSNLDLMYTKTGLKLLQDGDENGALNFFIKSLQIHPDYIPAQLEISKINVKKDNLLAAADSLINIYQNNINLTNDNDLLTEFVSTALLVNSSIINKGNEFLFKEDYNNAIILFEKGINFCSIVKLIDCDDKHKEGLKRAKNGLYQSYLKIAKKALNNGRLDMCSDYLDLAVKYKQNNIDEIENDKEYINILNALINAHTNKGIDFLNSKNYEKAMEHFNLAQNSGLSLSENYSGQKLSQGILQAKQGIYKNYILNAAAAMKKGNIDEAENIINKAITFQNENSEYILNSIGTDTILNNLYYLKYKNLISEGKKFIDYGYYQDALSTLLKARELEKLWKFKKEIFLDSLIASSAKPVILENLSNAQIKAWGNYLEEAENLYKNACSMQLTYKLNNDKYIASEIEKTKTKINERKCENENNLFNQYYSKSLKYINTNDFLLARDYLDMAINIAIDNPACNIPLVLASEKKSEFLPAFNYLNLISDAVKEYNTGNYKNVIVNYKTASQYYYDYKINNFSIIYIDFSDFLLMHDKPDFLLFCLNYFIENNMFNEALNTLTILKNNNYNAKETIKYQKKLGLKMAINDKENFKTEKASTLLIKYTGKDKYFRHFRSAYHRTWIKH